MDKVIYSITNIINGKRYIGSAVNFKNRKRKHKEQLSNKDHHSIHLQRAWDKHGKDNFKFEIIEHVPDYEDLIKIEQYYIDWFESANSEFGYNMSPVAGRGCPSEEGRKRISEANKGKFAGEKCPSAKLNWEVVREIRKEYLNSNITVRQMVDFYNCNSYSSIYDILIYHTWKEDDEIKQLIKEKLNYNNKHHVVSEDTKKKLSKIRKGLLAGNRNGRAKLNWDRVREIRERYEKENITHLKLSKEYGVSKRAITCILNYLTWKTTK